MSLPDTETSTTYFNSLSTVFKGLGTTVHLFPNNHHIPVDIAERLLFLKARFVKILISIPDPGPVGSITDPNDLVSSFTNAPYSISSEDADGNYIPSSVERLFAALKDTIQNAKIILCVIPPPSFLSTEATGMLTESSSILLFAHICAIAKMFLESYLYPVEYIQLFHRPDDEENVHGNMGENDLLLLATLLRQILAEKNLTAKFLLPGSSQVLSVSDIRDEYIHALQEGTDLVDIFAIDALENANDLSLVNKGDFSSRKLLGDQLKKNVAQINSIKFPLEKMATLVGTRATKFHSEGQDFLTSPAAQDRNEFAIRVCENLCSVLACSFSTALAPVINDPSGGLYREDGTPFPLATLMNKFTGNMVIPGTIFAPLEMNKTFDHTIKAMLMSSTGNAVSIILCKSKDLDPFEGKMTLVVNNELWSTAYEVLSYQVDSFPFLSLKDVSITTEIFQDRLVIDLRNLPNDAVVIFLKVAIELKPIVPVVPIEPDPILPVDEQEPFPIVLSTIMQIPVNFGLPTEQEQENGTVFFDLKTRTLKVFMEGTWSNATLLVNK
jgi:hypothetical protein